LILARRCPACHQAAGNEGSRPAIANTGPKALYQSATKFGRLEADFENDRDAVLEHRFINAPYRNSALSMLPVSKTTLFETVLRASRYE
jgi:hypothetical protein